MRWHGNEGRKEMTMSYGNARNKKQEDAIIFLPCMKNMKHKKKK
jgi:hypothetical protein